MFRKAATASIALLVFCFASPVWAGGGAPVHRHAVSVKRAVSTMSGHPIGAVNGAARTFVADQEGAFAVSALVPGVRFGRGASAGKTKPWIKLTSPLGDPVYVNMEQMVSVRPDTEISGAKTQIDFTSGKFQRVHEDVEQVMRLISAASDSQRGDETSSVALIFLGSSSSAPSHPGRATGDRICEDQRACRVGAALRAEPGGQRHEELADAAVSSQPALGPVGGKLGFISHRQHLRP